MTVTAAHPPHVPVMRERVVELLATTPPGALVDCTLGAGGHARALLEARARTGYEPALIGIDRDPEALDLARQRLASVDAHVRLVHAPFDRLREILDDLGIDVVAGVLFDLGISSMHVDREERGFSYRHDGPLDMRMDPTGGPTAADLVNGMPEDELARVIGDYGEERHARRIAAAIVAARPLSRTTELSRIVRDATPAPARRRGGDPARRTFQALRIAVNDELGSLERTLPQAIDHLVADGVCVVLSYHSLEDRLVHRAFGDAARGCICPPDLPVCACGRTPAVDLLTSRPERPDENEVARNPRARSAMLRAVRRRPEPSDTDEERS